MDHTKLWKILKEMGIPDHLTCLLGNLYAGQKATVRTGHGTTDWFQIRKGIGTRDKIVNIPWVIEKAREFQKNIYFYVIGYAKAFVRITTYCGKFLKRCEYQTTLPAS